MQRLKMVPPEYISKASARSLWQEYQVYPDRLELQFWIFLKTVKIPAEKIVDVKVVSPILKNREKQNFLAWFWGLLASLFVSFGPVEEFKRKGAFIILFKFVAGLLFLFYGYQIYFFSKPEVKKYFNNTGTIIF